MVNRHRVVSSPEYHYRECFAYCPLHNCSPDSQDPGSRHVPVNSGVSPSEIEGIGIEVNVVYLVDGLDTACRYCPPVYVGHPVSEVKIPHPVNDRVKYSAKEVVISRLVIVLDMGSAQYPSPRQRIGFAPCIKVVCRIRVKSRLVKCRANNPLVSQPLNFKFVMYQLPGADVNSIGVAEVVGHYPDPVEMEVLRTNSDGQMLGFY
ncbi:MAG: hypothetical protein BWY95_01317 [Bacteroidetes bacterium ADurb.BinA104]|nr:MAG: hypothetical protein BWY95_01317 [Bacteroidetes bacterium ADurb.BinA104]